MANVVVNDTNLTNIANAIREKNGLTNTYKPSEMAAAILAITTGGGGADVKPIVLTGEQMYGCAGTLAGEYINLYGNKISTNDISSADSMFIYNTAQSIPFTINYKSIGGYFPLKFSSMFAYSKVTTSPRIRLDLTTIDSNTKVNLESMFFSANYLRNADDTFVSSEIEAAMGAYKVDNEYITHHLQSIFDSCYSLRTAPDWIKHIKLNPESTSYPAYSYHLYDNLFKDCYALDEIKDLPVITLEAKKATTNYFQYTFHNLHHLRSLTFETNNDGSPLVANWTDQIIDLTQYVGYAGGSVSMINYNSGLTMEMEIKRGATGTKNPEVREQYPNDWWTQNKLESRYNLASAIETINSLPDTSAALATGGTANTIKFGGQGSVNDGTYIGNMPEENIAVATSKGWTVSLS